MKILITGASGFIGSYVCDFLKNCDIQVACLGRKKIDGCSNFFELDFFNQDNLVTSLKKINATHLIHLAWYTEHSKFWESTENIRWIEITNNLVDAFCRTGGQKVVIAGTCAEYDWNYGYCSEELTPLNPVSLYGISKDASHRMAKAICNNYQVPLAWGRVFYPFGIGENENRLIPSIIDVFRGHREPFGIDLDLYRDYIYVTDVAEALVMLTIQNCQGAFNISSSKPTKLDEIVSVLADLLGSNSDQFLSLKQNKIEGPKLLVGDNKKIASIGWQPKLSLIDGLKLTLENR